MKLLIFEDIRPMSSDVKIQKIILCRKTEIMFKQHAPLVALIVDNLGKIN